MYFVENKKRVHCCTLRPTFFLLTFVVIGVPLLIVLAVAGIVFPIVGAIKANSGEFWEYPCTRCRSPA